MELDRYSGGPVTLERLVDHDSNMLELYASQKDEAFFPNDVCRDGYQHLNWRLV